MPAPITMASYWTETQTSSADVLAYLDHVADQFDLRKDIQFDARVVDARWDARK